MLRPGRAGSNTAADHITLVDNAIAAIPAKHRRRLLISVDGAGASHDLINHLDILSARPGWLLWWTVGWELGDRERRAISLVPQHVWQVAIDTGGLPRTSRDEHADIVDAAQVADITDLIRSTSGSLAGWPASMRIIARRERPHPGAPLSLFEQHHGWRYHLFATHIPRRLPAGHPNAVLNNLAYLDATDRSHARVEDRIRCAKSCGLGKFPSHTWERNKAWLTAASLAQTLLAWLGPLALDGDLARAEPHTLRHRLLHAAAKLTRGQRRRYLRIDQTWPWTPDLVRAITRIQALPAGP